MTHDELLKRLTRGYGKEWQALRAVVELHRPVIHALPSETCLACQDLYPCPTIQAITKELK